MLEFFSGHGETFSIARRPGQDYAHAMISRPVSPALPLPTTPPASLFALFAGFLQVAVCSFGGAFAWAHRILVLQRRWLDEGEFAEALGLCQVLPGPNIVNLSVHLGDRFFGLRGAIVALAGLTAVPIGIVVTLESLYLAYSHVAALVHMLAYMGAAAAGLVIGVGLRMLWRLPARPMAYIVAGAAFVAVGMLGLPLPAVVLVLVPLAILLAWAKRL